MKGNGTLNVAIDPQTMPGVSGGVAQAAMSLVSGLGQLDGPETYTIITRSQEQLEWLKGFAGSNQRFVMKRTLPKSDDSVLQFEDKRRPLPQFVKKTLGPALPCLRFAWNRYLLSRKSDADFSIAQFLKDSAKLSLCSYNIPVSDGFYESLGCHVLHIPVQGFVLSALPTIYNPHDLQQEHYPHFFPEEELKWRDMVYPAGCHLSHTVVVGSQWIKDDVVRCYGVNPRKIQVVPEAAPTELYGSPSQEFLSEIVQKYTINRPFAFYPAVTWPHKKHIVLLEALALLRDTHNIVIHLVCTGSRYEQHWPEISACMDRLNLSGQVKFLGFVPEEDLRALYQLSQFLIQPSLFEASSLPIFEAWLEGVPVACSNVSALPDQVQDSALLFDPNSVESVADAMMQLNSSSSLRHELQAKGYKRLKNFDLERTSKLLRAVYRRAAQFPLTEEDHWLLSWDWMKYPHKRKGD